MQNNLQNIANEFTFHSFAIDGSTDVKDIRQLLIFVRCINDKSDVTEELAGFYSMKGRKTGKVTAKNRKMCITEKLSQNVKNDSFGAPSV